MNDLKEKQIQDFLENALKELKINKYEVNIRLQDFTASNFSSNIGEIVVKGITENTKKVCFYLFVKAAKLNQLREILATKEFFTREIYVYKFVFPLFKKIQEENRVKNVVQSVPKFFASSGVDGCEILIIENMVKKGFKVCDREKTFDYQHASMLIKEIGRLHALSFAARDQYPQLFEAVLSQLPDLEYRGKMGKTCQYLIKNLFPQCIDLIQLSTNRMDYIKFKKFQTAFFQALIQCTNEKNPYCVVAHGDLWTTNLMFKYDKSIRLIDLCILDWQMAKAYSPALDISQIMFMCLTKEVRDLYYDVLINDYYKSFSTFLMELGSNPHVLFPFEVLQDQLRRFSVPVLHTAMRVIKIVSIDSKKFPVPDENFLHGFCNAESYPDLYNNRMRDVLLDYVQYGYDLY